MASLVLFGSIRKPIWLRKCHATSRFNYRENTKNRKMSAIRLAPKSLTPSSDSVSLSVVNSKALAGGLVIATINMIVVAG